MSKKILCKIGFHDWEILSGIGSELYWYGRRKFNGEPKYKVVEKVERQCRRCEKYNNYCKHKFLDLLLMGIVRLKLLLKGGRNGR